MPSFVKCSPPHHASLPLYSNQYSELINVCPVHGTLYAAIIITRWHDHKWNTCACTMYQGLIHLGERAEEFDHLALIGIKVNFFLVPN